MRRHVERDRVDGEGGQGRAVRPEGRGPGPGRQVARPRGGLFGIGVGRLGTRGGVPQAAVGQ